MKKVLFYLHFSKVGGAEMVAMQYINTLLMNGFFVHLIIDFDMGKKGNSFETRIPSGVSYQYIKSETVSRYIYYLRTLGKKNKLFNIPLYISLIVIDFYYYHTKVKQIVCKGEYDFTISFYQFLPAYLTRIKRAKHIIWMHGSVEHMFDGITKFFIKSFGTKLNKYDRIVTIADEMKNQLKDFYPNISADKISMLYNPFDIKGMQCESKKIELLNDFEKGLISDDYICTVTRLDEHQKDVTTLIKAYHLLFARNNIKEKLYIIGDGPSYSELNKLISKLKLEKQILLIGSSATPLVWMDNAKVFVLSSKYEGLPSVIIEAMSVKTFVISSKCKTGPAEMLGDGYYGELFDVGNVEQLADSIYKALNDVSYRDTKVARASDRVNVFDVNTIANNFLKMLQSL